MWWVVELIENEYTHLNWITLVLEYIKKLFKLFLNNTAANLHILNI